MAREWMSKAGGKMADHLPSTQVISRRSGGGQSHTPTLLRSHASSLLPFSCRHMERVGQRGGDGGEHICHLFASSKNEQHVKECLPLVQLTSLSSPTRGRDREI